jgi:hypothetical protein
MLSTPATLGSLGILHNNLTSSSLPSLCFSSSTFCSPFTINPSSFKPETSSSTSRSLLPTRPTSRAAKRLTAGQPISIRFLMHSLLVVSPRGVVIAHLLRMRCQIIPGELLWMDDSVRVSSSWGILVAHLSFGCYNGGAAGADGLDICIGSHY